MPVGETSLRVEKHNHGIPVCSAGEITLKFVHAKRGLEAMVAIGVIPRWRGAHSRLLGLLSVLRALRPWAV